METLIIIGAGPAGYTAALYAARANLKPLLIAGTMPGGLLTQTTDVENFPGFPEGIMGPELMIHMQDQAERFGARIEYDTVESASLTDGGTQTVRLSDGRELSARALIIATGAVPRTLGIPAEKRLYNHGVSACATCDGAFYPDVPVAVIGGGDSAMEEAMFLTRFASKVYVVHRRDELRASPIMADRAKANQKIEFIWDSVVEDMSGDQELDGLLLRNVETDERSKLDCRACFVALGHVPNTGLFQDFLKLDEQRFVVLEPHSSKTSLKGVFAGGDCADPHYRQAITAAGMGCRAAMDAERYLN